MICTTGSHFWLWSGADSSPSAPDHIRCQCGQYSAHEWRTLEAENARLTALLAERDAAVALAERAESERDVYRDALTLISRGVWTARNCVESIVWGARKALKEGAALATASEGSSLVTTRTITMRCHCGRGVTIGPDPWCEGCVQSAATCDCVPVVTGEGA